MENKEPFTDSAEHINDVPIYVRPQRQNVNMFDSRQVGSKEPGKGGPVVLAVIGAVLVIGLGILVAFGVGKLLDGGNVSSTLKLEEGNQ